LPEFEQFFVLQIFYIYVRKKLRGKIMPPIQAYSALNVFDLRKATAPQQAVASNPISNEITPRMFNFSLSHPRVGDSDGVPAGTSPLAKKLDVCW